MFEKFKQKRADQRARAHDADVLAAKKQADAERASEISELQALLSIAHGNSSPMLTALMLKEHEIGVAQISNVGLIEERKGAGQWVGGSQGVSIPIGRVAGRSIRYRVGSTRGHYVQGAPISTAVDRGTLSITNQRIVFQGSKKSAECLFVKLLGIQHVPGGLVITVSNRQKATTLHFGVALDEWVSSRLNIALALYHGDGAQCASQLEAQIHELESPSPSPSEG